MRIWSHLLKKSLMENFTFLFSVDGIESRECPKSRYLKMISSSVIAKLLSTETAHSELHNLQIR